MAETGPLSSVLARTRKALLKGTVPFSSSENWDSPPPIGSLVLNVLNPRRPKCLAPHQHLVVQHLPVGRQEHQNAENPRWQLRFFGHVEEPHATFTEVRAIPVSCLDDAPATVWTLDTHGPLPSLHLRTGPAFSDFACPQLTHPVVTQPVLDHLGDPPLKAYLILGPIAGIPMGFMEAKSLQPSKPTTCRGNVCNTVRFPKPTDLTTYESNLSSN
jgi:hypothetical protein